MVSDGGKGSNDEQALLRDLVDELREHLRASQRENERLRHQMDQLLRRMYGRKTERFDPSQAELDLGPSSERRDAGDADDDDDDSTVGPAVFDPPTTGTKRRRGRRKLPENLPRKRIGLEPEAHELVGAGCAQPKDRIGEDVIEELEYEPAVIRVNEYARPYFLPVGCQRLFASPP
ncbi:MAG: hypothetical protein ACREQL_15645 [Candidatus Binatia bacterium]